MEIADFTAVITGATGRLGRAIALGLAARGMDCVCHYHRDGATAEALVEEMGRMGRRAAAIEADLGDEDNVKRFFERCKTFGRVRVLVNSAAVFQRHPLAELTDAVLQQTLRVNLAGPMLTSRYFSQMLAEEGLDPAQAEMPFAKIVNLADIAAVRPWAEYAAYCASKAGLIGLTKAMAGELAPGITVNAVAPGIITWTEEIDARQTQKQLARIPAGRFGRPEEIVRSIAFLLENDYITGQVLAVDGGRSI